MSWSTHYHPHPMYAPVKPFLDWLPLSTWPDQQDYDQLVNTARQNGIALPEALRFVCGLEPEDYYEIHIAKTGEIPTRAQDWHDWFNALCWLAWPNSKVALNQRHQDAMAAGELKRGPIRDCATLLDECGIVMACSDAALTQALDNMQWQQLFVERREAWGRQIKPFIIGHALYETGLSPHIGWCGKAYVIDVPEHFFMLDDRQQQKVLDELLASRLTGTVELTTPKALWPLPLLGIPGWCTENEHPGFYENTDYFRPSRRAKASRSVVCSVDITG